jgi:hypothetical protein
VERTSYDIVDGRVSEQIMGQRGGGALIGKKRGREEEGKEGDRSRKLLSSCSLPPRGWSLHQKSSGRTWTSRAVPSSLHYLSLNVRWIFPFSRCRTSVQLSSRSSGTCRSGQRGPLAALNSLSDHVLSLHESFPPASMSGAARVEPCMWDKRRAHSGNARLPTSLLFVLTWWNRVPSSFTFTPQNRRHSVGGERRPSMCGSYPLR